MRKRVPTIILICLIAVVIACSLISGCTRSNNYIKDVKNWKPYTSYGIKSTVGAVFDKYLAPCEWTQGKDANGVTYYVNANGQIDGDSAQMRFYVNVSSTTISWGVQRFTLGNDIYEKDDAEVWLEDFFDAYEEGYDDIIDFFTANQPSWSATLTQIYTNNVEGITFKYPKEWVQLSPSETNEFLDSDVSDFVIAFFVADNEDPEISSFITVNRFYSSEMELKDFYNDPESFIKSTFYEEDRLVIQDLSAVYINDILMERLIYTIDYGVKVAGIRYYYSIGNTMYRIDFECISNQIDFLKPVFEEIIKSYKITRSGGADKSENLHTGAPTPPTNNNSGNAGNNAGLPPAPLLSPVEEARLKVQNWLDAHNFPASIISVSDTQYYYRGEAYYAFSLSQFWWFEILASNKTGELLGKVFYDGQDCYETIEPLENWYNRTILGKNDVPLPSELRLKGETYTIPRDQFVGSIFGVRGIIESNYLIVSVTVAVYNDSGYAETISSASPFAYTYDIKKLDYDLLFDKLTPGQKTYVIEATDEMDSKVLLESTFWVNRR